MLALGIFQVSYAKHKKVDKQVRNKPTDEHLSSAKDQSLDAYGNVQLSKAFARRYYGVW